MKRPSPFLVLASLAALSSTACPSTQEGLCDSVVCDSGYVCDEESGQCVQKRLEVIEGEPPGRSSRVVMSGGDAFVASIRPTTGEIIAGEISRNAEDFRILFRPRRARTRLALDANDELVAVAWLGDEARYTVAWRQRRASNAYWNYLDIVADITYAGTEDFDLRVTEVGPVIAFHAPDRTLKLLRSQGGARATLTTVDDGAPSANGVACPDEIRDTERVGVGKHPDLLITSDDATYIAYQDADCGDLRVARDTSGTWSIDVVDTGAFDSDTGIDQRGRVGEYASIAVEPGGRAAIAYFDASRGQLKYARGSEGGWDIQVVDRGLRLDQLARERKDVVGTFASLAFNDLGLPRIAYMNGSTLELRVAERNADGSRWLSQTLAGDGVVGFHADHAFSDELGTLTVAERLTPGPEGLISTLVMLWE